MDSYSCCDGGMRQTCEVQYYEGNYHVVYGKEDCSCVSGGCACNCVKGDACGYNEVDCSSTSWTDSCVLGNSPSCCDSANGIRQKCEYTGGNKVISGSVVIDACTGEGFGTQSCTDCLGATDPLCDASFSAGCSDTVSYCSDPEIGYRLSCLDGVQTVECTCDPTPADQ
jgi:hypothetical protein